MAAEFPDRPEYRLLPRRGNRNLGVLLGDIGRAQDAEQAYLGPAKSRRRWRPARTPPRRRARSSPTRNSASAT